MVYELRNRKVGNANLKAEADGVSVMAAESVNNETSGTVDSDTHTDDENTSNDCTADDMSEPISNELPELMISMSVVRDLVKQGRVALVVDGTAWDLTDFAEEHPGGRGYLDRNVGLDCTAEFIASHPLDIIERTLSRAQFARSGSGSMYLGKVDPATVQAHEVALAGLSTHERVCVPAGNKPSLESCINVFDFESIARETVPQQGWVYYSSGADDEITLRENHCAFQRIWLRPRVLVNVRDVDTRTTILGKPSSLPLMLCAVAMCKLGHPDGEVAWNKAAGAQGIIYMIPTLSGCSFDDITGAKIDGQNMFFQLYVNQDRLKTKAIVEKAEKAGCSALFITVDAPQLGNREKDRRVKVSHAGANVQSASNTKVKKSEGTAKALTTFIDPSLCWDDLDWFASITNMRIVLKGVATAEDAITALEHGKVAGIMLSNHGGRQLDGARSAIEILPEVLNALKGHPKYDPRTFEVYLDGGVRRGTDIYKALALGCTAVGIGRPALYAMSAFGQQGVDKCIQILREELEMTMRLMGTPTLADIKKQSVITTDLDKHTTAVPHDFLVRQTYQPKVTAAHMSGFQRAAAATAAPTSTVHASPSPPPIAQKDSPLSSASAFIALLKQMAVSTVMTVFASPTDARMSMHRSALFLVVFLVVHVAGNQTVFLGRDVFNAYGHKIASFPLYTLLEYYLLIAFGMHACLGLYLSWAKRKFLAKAPLQNAPLLLSSVVVSGFVLLHVWQFRFDDVAVYTNAGVEMRDIYGRALDLFQSPVQVALYVFCVLFLGWHLWLGWAKTVQKMGADRRHQAHYKTIGQLLVWPVTIGFCVIPIYFHLFAKSA